MNPRPRAWVVALAFALYSAMVLLRVFAGERDEPGAVVFAPAVALLALELGVVPGLLGALLGTALFYVTVDDVATWDLVVRALSLLALGGLVGALGTRLRGARAVVRTAREINDNVIQSLVLARYALDRGDVAEASGRVDETLREAREIVQDLVEPEHMRPGDLRRETAARVR